MIACCGWPSAVFLIWMTAISAPQVTVGTCTAMTLGRLRRSEFRISASRDAADQNVIRGRPRSNRVKHRVTPHVKSLGDKDILGAAVRRITSELTERSFRLAHIVEDLAFDHDFRTCRDIELRGAASRDAIGLTKERADD